MQTADIMQQKDIVRAAVHPRQERRRAYLGQFYPEIRQYTEELDLHHWFRLRALTEASIDRLALCTQSWEGVWERTFDLRALLEGLVAQEQHWGRIIKHVSGTEEGRKQYQQGLLATIEGEDSFYRALYPQQQELENLFAYTGSIVTGLAKLQPLMKQIETWRGDLADLEANADNSCSPEVERLGDRVNAFYERELDRMYGSSSGASH